MTTKCISILRKAIFLLLSTLSMQVSAQTPTQYDVPLAGNAYITTISISIH